MNKFTNVPIFDIQVFKGVTTSFVFEVEDESDESPDLSGYTATLAVKVDANSASNLFTNTPVISGNLVTMTISATESSTHFGSYNRLAFNLKITTGGNTVLLAVGIITIPPFTI